MARILVTGGTGVLGSEIVSRLTSTDHIVRIMSRSVPQSEQHPKLEWAQADLLTGKGVAEALREVDIIINAASQPMKMTYDVDVVGAKRMLEQARQAQVGHVLHISIVGIDKIPYRYYQHKVAAEQIVRSSGIPWSILRATQFHNLIDFALQMVTQKLAWSPVLPLPTDFQFQTVDAGEVADHLLPYITTPSGYMPEFGGPEVMRLGDMARVWMREKGLRHAVLPLPLPGKIAAGFRAGYNTTPDHAGGKISWMDWVQWRHAHYKRDNLSNEQQAVGQQA
jgi:uncharacterized protein YbjT (DUF2867 family)